MRQGKSDGQLIGRAHHSGSPKGSEATRSRVSDTLTAALHSSAFTAARSSMRCAALIDMPADSVASVYTGADRLQAA